MMIDLNDDELTAQAIMWMKARSEEIVAKGEWSYHKGFFRPHDVCQGLYETDDFYQAVPDGRRMLKLLRAAERAGLIISLHGRKEIFKYHEDAYTQRSRNNEKRIEKEYQRKYDKAKKLLSAINIESKQPTGYGLAEYVAVKCDDIIAIVESKTIVIEELRKKNGRTKRNR